MKKFAKLSLICFLGMFFSSCSDIFITSIVDAKKPKIITQPVDVQTDEVQGITLSVKAKSLDGGEILYEWFESATEDMEDAESVGNLAEFIKEKPAIGTYYYYCKITNKNEDRRISGKTTAYTVTNTVKVIVEEGKYKYTVEHYKQNIEDDGYSLVEYDTDILSGLKSTYTEAQSKNYEGFDSKEIKQQIIEEDGSTVVKVYYDRKIITLTFDLNGGTTNTILYNGKLSGKYGSRVEFENPQKEGYSLSSWENGKPVPYTFPEQDETYVAVWVGKNDTAYKVEHYQQNIADNEYTLFDTENKAGITNSDTSAVAKTYAGFTSQSFTQGKISSDGKTVVKIYYSRNEYILSFDTDGGTTIDSIKLKYGAAITVPENPERVGYSFAEWNPDIPNTMPSGNIELKAVWIAGEATAYKVEHYQQNLNDDNYTLVSTDNKAGKTNTDTNAVAKNYEGFTVKTFSQEKIAGDGTTIVKLYYTRDLYTITFNTDGGTTINSMSLKHGATITPPVNPTKVGYTFKNWDRVIPSVMPKENLTFKALWNPKKYTITYKDINNGSFTGTFNSTYPEEHLYGTSTILTEPSKECCIFIGWYVDSGCEGKSITSLEATSVTSDITLYAKWIDGFVTSVADLPGNLAKITDRSKVYTIRITDETPLLRTLKTILDNNKGDNFRYGKKEDPIKMTYDLSLCTGLTEILYDAFNNCKNLCGFIIPNSVTSICSNAFYNCDLTEITIPESVVTIKESAFVGCKKLEKLYITDLLSWCNIKLKNISSSPFSSSSSEAHHVYVNGEEITSLIIPNDVSSIRDFLFIKFDNIKSVAIPNTVSSIGNMAFANCTGLTEIEIPNGVTNIGNRAFMACTSLSEIIIPNSIVSINAGTFANCTSLTEVYIPNSVKEIGMEAFAGCSLLTEITIPDSITTINNATFSNCTELKEIVIPDNVKSIKDNAFASCTKLSEVYIPSSLTDIGKGVFSECYNVEKISIDSNNTKYDSRNDCNAIIETSTNTLLQGCYNTNIPNSIVSIADSAFSGCSKLKSISIPDSVKSIGEYAFWGCSNATELIIPDGVTSIGVGAFQNCQSVQEIKIPDSVKFIGDSAFSACYVPFRVSQNIFKILCPKLDPYYYIDAYKINLVGTIDFSTLPGILETAQNGVKIEIILPNINKFSISQDGLKILLPSLAPISGVYYITLLGNVDYSTLPAILETAPKGVDVEITLPNGGICSLDENNNFILKTSLSSTNSFLYTVTDKTKTYTFKISNSFPSLSQLKTILNNHKDINIAFDLSECSGLTTVETEAFYNCYNLASITIPSSVTSISSQAFEHCKGLESIIVDKNNPKYDSRNDCNAVIETATNTLLYGCQNTVIPDTVTSIGPHAFCEQSNLKEITIPSSVKTIQTHAFYGCSGLNSVTISSSVTSIGTYAFRNCSGLTSVTIPSSVQRIGSYAFFGCSKLNSLTFEDTTTWYKTDNKDDWVHKSNGTKTDVSSASQNAQNFSKTDGYYNDYWYKL